LRSAIEAVWVLRVPVGAALVLLAPAAGLLLPRVASAEPGDHVRVGEATITPSVQTGFEFHTNTYKADGGDGAPEIPSLAWTFKPRVQLDLTNRIAKVDLGAGYGLKKFIDLDTTDAFHPENADQYSNFDAQLAVIGLPQSKVGFRIDDKFQSEAIAAELYAEEEIAGANIYHVGNDTTAGVAVRPGTALEVDALGMIGLDTYKVPIALVTDDNPNYNDRIQYGPQLTGSWKFLPKTSLLTSFSYSFLRWDKNLVEALGPEVEGSNIGDYIGKPDSEGWRFTAGVNGQFTQKLAAAAIVGFGQMNYDEQSVIDDAAGVPDSSSELNTTGDETFATDTSALDGLLFKVQGSWAPIRGQTFTLGYQKDFQDAVFTNYVAYNYLFFRYEGTVQNRLSLTGELAYRIDVYHGEINRGDQNLTMKAGAAYKITSYLSAGAGLQWDRRACLDKDCEGVYYSTQYDDVTVSAGATFTY
jgi:hypothetical protein